MPASVIDINLLPEDMRGERYGSKFLQWALTYGRYIIIVTELIVLLAFFSRFKFDQELSDLHEVIQHKQAVIESVADFEKEVRILQDRIAKIGVLEKDHLLYLQAIKILNDIVPEDVILSNLSFQKLTVSLRAVAYSRKGLSNFLQMLKETPNFESIHVGAIEQSGENTGELSMQVSMGLITKE